MDLEAAQSLTSNRTAVLDGSKHTSTLKPTLLSIYLVTVLVNQTYLGQFSTKFSYEVDIKDLTVDNKDILRMDTGLYYTDCILALLKSF